MYCTRLEHQLISRKRVKPGKKKKRESGLFYGNPRAIHESFSSSVEKTDSFIVVYTLFYLKKILSQKEKGSLDSYKF